MYQWMNWYALQVRQRTEKLTAQLLNLKGYEPFLPTYLLERRWSDRIKTFDQPLFPGYLFCRLDPLLRLPILTTPGVISIVGAGREPIAIPETEVNAVWRIVESAASAEPWPYLTSGDTVRIAEGPLQGVDGILVTLKNSSRVVVSINLLQRSIAVEVDRRAVLPTQIARHLPGRVTPSIGTKETLPSAV
ncbi:MAG TPA: UpxY family transcription antiterminator [Bryobacteraceae bacterium]